MNTEPAIRLLNTQQRKQMVEARKDGHTRIQTNILFRTPIRELAHGTIIRHCLSPPSCVLIRLDFSQKARAALATGRLPRSVDHRRKATVRAAFVGALLGDFSEPS